MIENPAVWEKRKYHGAYWCLCLNQKSLFVTFENDTTCRLKEHTVQHVSFLLVILGGGGVRPDRCLMIQACTTLWCYCDSSCRSFVAVGCLCPLNCRWGASQGLCWGEGPCPQALEGRFSSSASPHWGLLSPDRQGRETSWNTEVQRWAPIS